MNEAITNARRLCKDAKTLLTKSRFPTALSLAALSIEESGKLPILRTLALAQNQKEASKIWREYRTHTRKNTMWPFLQMFLQGARRLSDFRILFDDTSEHPYILDNLKQIGFYTDCLGKRHWSNPDHVIDESIATNIVNIAEILLPKREVTEREIQLWIKYVKPAWMKPMELMEAAVASWHRQMCKEGLLDDNPESMENFIIRGIGTETNIENK
ncbi:MAG: AbiV family abortive infection protein [Phycisphaerae bacterium]|nr:AbiV family abortive infection protein [Phycisphaerae bacterium]